MKDQKEMEEKISQLQLIEQNLQNYLIQRQALQAQKSEIDNAIAEIKKTKDKVYKITGPIMVSVDKDALEKDLNSTKEVIDIKIKNFGRQEAKLKEKAEELQKEVLKNIKGAKNE